MYNEAENVENTVTRIVSILNEQYKDWELVIVDDGSSDSTLQIAQNLALKNPRIKVFQHPRNLGYGQALRTGFRNAKGDVIVTIDADLSYDPRNIIALVDTLKKSDGDIVLGSPYAKGKVTGVPIHRLIISKLGNMILGYVLKSNIRTFTGILRAYNKESLDCLDLRSNGKEIEPEIIAKAIAMGFELIEIPAELRGRERGASKFSARKIVTSHLKFSLEQRPLILFIFVSMILFMLGFAISLYLIYELFFLGLGIMRPILILGAILIISGVQTFMFGFMSDQLSLLRDQLSLLRREIRERTLHRK